MKNIILTGFMGSGKTAMGRFLSEALDYDFFDTDREMEEATGLKINQIAKKYGEIRFRSEEKLVLKRLGPLENAVIATGGTFIDNDENIDLLKANGIFVFLKTDEATIVDRLSRRSAKPFKEKGTLRELVAKYYALGLPRYEKYADIIVDTGGLSMEETAAIILKEYERKK
ncbi:MAG: shikimate kinase [Bacillota bacterium]|nr:shikimate kinase [Bacillota bacterium]